MQTALILLVFAVIASIAGNVIIVYFLTKFHQDEKRELHNRLMSRDYPEFKMAQDYDLELKRKEREIEVEGKERLKEEKMTKEELHRRNLARQF